MEDLTLQELVGHRRLLEDELVLTEGEVTDDLISRLLAIQGATKDKVERTIDFLNYCESQAEMFRSEADKIYAKAQKYEGTYERLREYVKGTMIANSIDSVPGNNFGFVIERAKNSVEVFDESAVPEEFVKIHRRIDKEPLRQALKDGRQIPGAHLVEGQRFSVRPLEKRRLKK